MLRLRAFRPTGNKIMKIQLHPTHPWLVTADDSDNVSVWNWEHRQVIYELKAGGVDQRRVLGEKLEKLAEGESDTKSKPTEAMRGGGNDVKQVNFYDDDVQFWQISRNRSAASEGPSSVSQHTSNFSSPASSTRGRHFLVICCENKAIFLDLVTMRGRDVPKQELDNRSLLCGNTKLAEEKIFEFFRKLQHGIPLRSPGSDGPLVAFGASDGVIRVLSMITWKLVRRYTGGHKGSISCLMTFMAASGESLLVSGASDGLIVIWNADYTQDSRELAPKLNLKAHDGGVVGVELSRVMGSAPQLITIGADKTLAIWDTISFKELRRIKPVPKLACHSVASWCHPRHQILIFLLVAIEHPTYSALTRPLCELSSLIPPQVLAPNKKLRVYCMVAHPLQPHLVATGTNIGVMLSEFDPRSLPAVAPLATPTGSREHSAVYVVERELKLLTFQLSNATNPSLGGTGSTVETGRARGDFSEVLHVKQNKKHISTPAAHDSYSVLSVSSSGKYVAIVWPEIPSFSIYKVSDWSVVDSGSGRLFAWDTCRDRYALLETGLIPRIPVVLKSGLSRKAKEAAAAAAQAAAAAASAASAATVQVRILLDDGTSHVLTRSIEGRNEPVVGLYGGALLGVAYKTSRRVSPMAATAISTMQSMPLSADDSFSSSRTSAVEAAPQNFQLYSWETFQPVGGLLSQPEWTAWDQTVEYCAFAYHQHIVISSLRPQYRCLGDVAIPCATGAVWHRRQLFVATPTTIECVFVDAGVALIDLETKRKKEEQKLKEAQNTAFAEHGELALITVDNPQKAANERISLRPPMLQVVRLASFQHAPSIPPFISLPKQYRVDGEDSAFQKDVEERKASEVAVAGGGMSVAITRFPPEQRRPVGPLVLVGVRDGVLWLIDSLSHPGIRCRCLAAYGDAVSAVKWASRLAREHHDDLAQFMLGLEFDLAMQSNDLKRALQCLLTMSNSRDVGQDSSGTDISDILSLSAVKQENLVDAVQGIVKFAQEFLDLIDAADATGQGDIAREALKRLSAAGSVKGALESQVLRGLALRLANHGELTRLSGLVGNLATAGQGREAAFSAAVLGDNALMEKAWQDTGMLAEAVLHAHAHGRPTLKNLVIAWNKMLQKELEHTPSGKTDAATAFFASLEEPKLTSLAEAGKKPPIEILPPGMASLSAPISIKKPPAPPAQKAIEAQPNEPLMLEAPPKEPPPETAPPPEQPVSEPVAPSENGEAPPAPIEVEAQAAPAG
ncbi:unnamed protein product [Spirodela intermedia]|uniref:Uncharacterized protein n=1 Tax=Spirodela intermedia TaxID=51605 RepID=A0A7I8JQ39_SPIIN|nr:unnamed protein product [Spirodela intermedia]CAA6671552.1 unnamed protein product [Spirodela intermedia]